MKIILERYGVIQPEWYKFLLYLINFYYIFIIIYYIFIIILLLLYWNIIILLLLLLSLAMKIILEGYGVIEILFD